jgi:hypothetical protein
MQVRWVVRIVDALALEMENCRSSNYARINDELCAQGLKIQVVKSWMCVGYTCAKCACAKDIGVWSSRIW